MTDISKEPAEKSPEVAGNRPLAGALDSAASNSTVADLYLLCYIPSPLFHAHWALFVPDQADPQRGTVINIRGDPLNGFDHEIQRDYVPSEDPDKPPFMTKLGSLEDTLVVRPHRSLEAGKDAVAYTDLERLALSIPAPGPSLGRSRASTGGRVKRVEIRDCQWWVGQFVDKMIEMKMLSTEAQEVLTKAPKH